MNVKTISFGVGAWLVLSLLTISKGKADSLDVNNTLDLPSIKKLADDEIRRIEEENAKKELDKQIRNTKASPTRGVSRSVPKRNTSMKTYMGYKTITSKTSRQYKLQQRNDVYTDSEGFRRIDDKFMIALGTYFEVVVGQEVIVTLSSGNTFNAIIGDIKANKDTDSINLSHRSDGSVLEFLIDSRALDSTIKKMGDCSYSKENDFSGDVVSVEILDNIYGE